MGERGIIMSGDNPRRILDGTKTQTRRIANLEKLRVRLPAEVRGDGPFSATRAKPGTYRAKIGDAGAVLIVLSDGTELGVKPGEFHFVCPYADGKTHLADHGNGRKIWTITPDPDQRLWMRETWCLAHPECSEDLAAAAGRPRGPEKYVGTDDAWFAYYAATDPDVVNVDDHSRSPWKSPIHMPRWASRATLEVRLVELARLQDITEEDARAEGVEPVVTERKLYPSKHAATADHRSYRDGFERTWCAINGADSWKANPWAWAITFKRVEAARHG